MENTVFSPCGIDCTTCNDLGKTCAGCKEIKGKVFWTAYFGIDICPIYDCSVNQKGLKHCGECSELPCQIYYDSKDPSLTDEEHEKSIMDRAKILKGLANNA